MGRSDAGRMEDRGSCQCGVRGGLIICRDWRRCDLEHDQYAQGSPLIGAIRFRGDRRGRRRNRARAREARAGHATCRRRSFQWRPHRVAHDQRVEAGKVDGRIGPHRNEVVAAGPSRARRSETVSQKEQQCPGPQSRQSLERNGPHYTSVAERANPRWRKPASQLV
jgi:hypothetical protein